MAVYVFNCSRVTIGKRVGSNAKDGMLLVCFVEVPGTEAFVGFVDVGEIRYTGQFVEIGIAAEKFRITVVGYYWEYHVGSKKVEK